MPEQDGNSRVTVEVAAGMLGVPEESVQRYIQKGLLTAFQEGQQTTIPLQEVNALRDELTLVQSRWFSGSPRIVEPEQPRDLVMIERKQYECLLIELGELRKESQFLVECRAALRERDKELKDKERELEELKEILLETEWKDYELEQTQKHLRELEIQLAQQLRKPWWKRLLGSE